MVDGLHAYALLDREERRSNAAYVCLAGRLGRRSSDDVQCSDHIQVFISTLILLSCIVMKLAESGGGQMILYLVPTDWDIHGSLRLSD
jgi:hypothetical protein